MKNFFKSLAICALAALTFASCQKENAGGNMDDQSSVVSINLTSPIMGTKAFADGKTVDVVHVHVYKVGADNTLTYIAPGTGGTETPSKDVTMRSSGTATYSTRLVTGQTYTFVFWAEKSGNSHYTYDPATQTISVNYANAAGNDETRDAFYAVLPNVTITGAYSQSVTLKRPFAQVNFGVTQADMDYANAAGITVNGAAVKCTHVANQLNLLTETASGSVEAAFATNALPTSETLSVAGETYTYVAMNYVLVGKRASTLSDITLTLDATGAASATPEYTYTNIPLQGNFRTNIVGNLFTSPASINITVDSGFEGDIKNVSSIAEANTALDNGATNISISNITASDASATTLKMPATSESITISIESIESGANLTINQTSSDSSPASVAVTIPSSASVAQLTITLPQSHVEINGASYNSINATTSNNTLVIGKDVTVETLTIEAGAVEIYGKVKNLIKGEGAGDVKVWTVYSASEFKNAVKTTKNIVLGKNISTLTTIDISDGADVEIDLNGYKITKFYLPLKICNAKVKFKGNGTISASSQSVIQVIGSATDVADYTVVSIGKDVTVSNGNGSTWGILIDKDAAGTYNNYGIVLNIEGTITTRDKGGAGAITINGSNKNTTGNVPIINFDGANIDFGNIGIYAAGYAKWNLKNTNITGKISAMEVRAGEVTIDGGEYKATNTPFKIDPNGSGTTISGAALGISQHNTDLPVNVVVNNGTFTGEHAIHEEDVQNETGRESIKLTVNGGTFNGAIYSQNNQNCLVGGTYNDASVFNYTAEGYECLLNANDTYTVVTARDAGFYKNGDYTVISNLNGLKLFAMKVNSLGKTFKDEKLYLAANIDLEGAEWAPIGPNADGPNKFMGEFEGARSTISNFVINQGAGYHAAGFFGALNGTVQNLKFEDVTVKSISAGNSDGNTDNGTAIVAGSIYTSGLIHNVSITNCSVEGNRYVGGIAGYVYGSITNCTANTVNVTAKCDNLTGDWDNGDKAGDYAGDNTSTSIENNTVTASSVTAYRDFGGIAGSALDSANALVKNNKVDGLTLIVDKTHNYKNYTEQSEHNVNGAIGRGGEGTGNTTNNVTINY